MRCIYPRERKSAYDEADVAIIGGGPAGLSAGLVMANSGLRTVVFEARKFPVDKPCGEGVMPTGLAGLERLGVRQHFDPAGCHPIAGIRYISAGGRVASSPFAEGPGIGIRRTVLSSALLTAAGQTPSLEIREGCPARPLGQDRGRIVLEAGERQLRARLLIGADGLNSAVRSWAGLAGGPGRYARWGARQHFCLAPWTDYVEVYWSQGVEAYVTPVGPEQVGVAFLWHRDAYPAIRGGSQLIPSLLDVFPRLREHLGDAAPASAVRAVGPLQRTASGPVADGVLLVGDAAGYLDALTGEGISLAVHEALSLGDVIPPLLRERPDGAPLPTPGELEPYRRAHAAIVRPYYRMTGLVLFISRHPALAERTIALLSTRPSLFRRLLSASMGTRHPSTG